MILSNEWREVINGWYEHLGALKAYKTDGEGYVDIDFAIAVVEKAIMALEELERISGKE